MTTYRLIAIDGDDERGIGTIDTLEMLPGAMLVVSLPPETSDRDMARVYAELREHLTDRVPEWRDRPILVIRAGDARFLRLVPVETPAKEHAESLKYPASST